MVVFLLFHVIEQHEPGYYTFRIDSMIGSRSGDKLAHFDFKFEVFGAHAF